MPIASPPASSLRRLLGPLLLFLLVILVLVAWRGAEPVVARGLGERAVELVERLLEIGGWLAGGFLVVRAADVLLWHGALARRTGRPVSKLLTDLVAGLVWLVVGISVAIKVLDLPLAGVLTTSSVAVAVLGFALRDMLASLFAGIALNVERPYQIGDWIEFEGQAPARVTDVGWLTTRALTRDGVTVVVPNAQLATRPFRNYSHPDERWRDAILVTVDHAVAPQRVERILLAAAAEVGDMTGDPSPPDVKIQELGPRGIVWQLRFWVADTQHQQDIRYRVQRAVLRHLHNAGIGLPYAVLDVYHAAMPPRAVRRESDLDVLLRRNELLGTLADEELRDLARKAKEHRVPAGGSVVVQGEAGSSLFLVIEGVLDVWHRRADGSERRVNTLCPGDMLGEFSLLTGAPRSASVRARTPALLYEVTKEDLEPALRRCPELVDTLGRILAERQARLEAEAAHRSEAHAVKADEHAGLLDRIRTFFDL